MRHLIRAYVDGQYQDCIFGSSGSDTPSDGRIVGLVEARSQGGSDAQFGFVADSGTEVAYAVCRVPPSQVDGRATLYIHLVVVSAGEGSSASLALQQLYAKYGLRTFASSYRGFESGLPSLVEEFELSSSSGRPSSGRAGLFATRVALGLVLAGTAYLLLHFVGAFDQSRTPAPVRSGQPSVSGSRGEKPPVSIPVDHEKANRP